MYIYIWTRHHWYACPWPVHTALLLTAVSFWFIPTFSPTQLGHKTRATCIISSYQNERKEDSISVHTADWLPHVLYTLCQITIKWKPTGNNIINVPKLLQHAYILWWQQMDYSGMNSIIILGRQLYLTWHYHSYNTAVRIWLTECAAMTSSILLLHCSLMSLPQLHSVGGRHSVSKFQTWWTQKFRNVTVRSLTRSDLSFH